MPKNQTRPETRHKVRKKEPKHHLSQIAARRAKAPKRNLASRPQGPKSGREKRASVSVHKRQTNRGKKHKSAGLQHAKRRYWKAPSPGHVEGSKRGRKSAVHLPRETVPINAERNQSTEEKMACWRPKLTTNQPEMREMTCWRACMTTTLQLGGEREAAKPRMRLRHPSERKNSLARLRTQASEGGVDDPILESREHCPWPGKREGGLHHGAGSGRAERA